MNEIPKPPLVGPKIDPRQPTEPLAEPLVMTKGPGEMGALLEGLDALVKRGRITQAQATKIEMDRMSQLISNPKREGEG